MIQHYCCLLRISSIDRIDWRPPRKINWVQELSETENFVVWKLKLERTKSENDFHCYSCLSLVLYIQDFFRFLFFPSFSLELQKTNQKKNFNFVLSTWCFYWMRAWNAFEDVFIRSTLHFELEWYRLSAKSDSISRSGTEIEEKLKWHFDDQNAFKIQFSFSSFQHSTLFNIHDMKIFAAKMFVSLEVLKKLKWRLHQ